MKNEKNEFWFGPFFLAALLTGTFLFHRSYELDKKIWRSSQNIRVKVIDKRATYAKKTTYKIGIRHGLIPIYVYAGKRWFREVKLDSLTTVKYSSKYHAYMDPYHKFSADQFFLYFLIIMDIVVLWRATWLGLYIWYWKR